MTTAVAKGPESRSVGGWAVAALRELWPLLLITAAVSVIMGNVANTNWKEIFLYNGDSITLPLVLQSLQRGEPFEWVFSTQTFFFPEYPIYWLCSLVTPTVQAALVLNAFVNVFILYGLLRVLAGLFAPRRPLLGVALALGSVMVLLSAIASERSTFIMFPGIVAPSNIPTLFLLTTYYYGVMLLGVAGVVFTLAITSRFTRERVSFGRALLYGSVTVIVGAATMYSNPLYALMFALPLLVVLTFLVLVRRVPWRWYLLLAGGQVVAIAIGMAIRVILWRFIADPQLSGYLHPDRAWNAFLQVATVLRDWSVPGLGAVRLLALFGPLVVALVYLIVTALRRRRGHPPIETSRLFVLLFVLVAAASLVAGQIATGQHLTRYLVPLFIFPLMALVVVGAAVAERVKVERLGVTVRRGLVVGIAGAGVIAAALAGASTVPSVAQLAREPYLPAACFDEWADGRDVSGVATFMTARPLELYGDHEGMIVQTDQTVYPNAWMANLWTFSDRTFSFALVTNDAEYESAVSRLGEPGDVVSCDAFQILDYVGTPGEARLTEEIAERLGGAIDGREY